MADKKIIASDSTPADGEVVTWDAATSSWVAQPGGSYDGDVATSIELTRTTAVSTGPDCIVIGNGASNLPTRGIVIGKDATSNDTTNYDAIVMGSFAKAEARAANSVSIGIRARCDGRNATTGSGHIAIGADSEADASKRGGIAIGQNADSLYSGVGLTSGFTVGADAVSSDTQTVAIGHSADATASTAIAIGADAQGTAANAVAIGHDARSTVADAVSLGYDAEATQADAVAIGALSRASRTSSIVLNATGAASAPLTRDSTRINKLHHVVELRAAPTDGTPTEATSDGAAASTADDAARNVVVLADGRVASFRLHMTAIQATTNDAAVYIVTGGVKCLAGTASIIGATTTTAYEDDAGWDCTVTCTSNRLVVTCTADAGGASTWRGTLTLTYED